MQTVQVTEMYNTYLITYENIEAICLLHRLRTKPYGNETRVIYHSQPSHSKTKFRRKELANKNCIFGPLFHCVAVSMSENDTPSRWLSVCCLQQCRTGDDESNR